MLARFYSLKVPKQSALFDDMGRAWRLRSDMSYKSLRDNLFIITFSTEGDYNFVLQGGGGSLATQRRCFIGSCFS